MNPEYKDRLKKQKIKKFSRGKALVNKELKTAEDDLKTAKESFNNENYKWATIQCYYSMFHSARALLYSKNYRERSHYCLTVALRVFYGEMGFLSIDLIEGFQKAKTLRENAAVAMNSRIFRKEKGSWEIREETYTNRDDFNPKISLLRHNN